MADTRLTGLTNIGEQLALNDQLYVVNVSDTSQNAAGSSNTTLLNYVLAMLAPNPLRLTLETGVPVSITDQTAKSTLYATLYGVGNVLALYDGTRLIGDTISADLSLAVSGLTSGKNYDVVGYDVSGTPTLDFMPAWTNDTTRANAISIQNGFWANSGTITTVVNAASLTAGKGRVLGTVRATGATTLEDSKINRFVANIDNKVKRIATAYNATQHNYGSTERDWNNDTSSYCYFVLPLQGWVDLNLVMRMTGQTALGAVNIIGKLNVDGANVSDAPIAQNTFNLSGGITDNTTGVTVGTASSQGLSAGYHYANAREQDAASAGTTWYDVKVAASLLI
jgi:hypothetical protein